MIVQPPTVHYPPLPSAAEATCIGNGCRRNSLLFSPLSISTVRFWSRRAPPPVVALASSCFSTIFSIFKDSNRTDLSCSALRTSKGKGKGRKGGGVDVMDDDDDDDDDEHDGWADDEEEVDDEEMPLAKMRAWLRNKPRGFGEGKTYDVSLEEELLNEIEQSSKAQLANVNRLKNNQKNAVSSQKKPRKQTTKVTPNGVRVRVRNLPKKKNIHRDLQSAFKEFAGITNISPAVSGNRKTRDPICKGFAFVDLKSEEVAERFLRMYSNQSLKFGKVEKCITCHIINPSCSLATSTRESSDNEANHMMLNTDNPSLAYDDTNQELPGKERNESKERDSSLDDSVSPVKVIDKVCSEELSANFSSSEESLDQISGELAGGNSTTSAGTSTNSQSKLKRQRKKPNQQNGINQSILGSAIRLKGKERTILSDVFSKYGGNVAPDLAKES